MNITTEPGHGFDMVDTVKLSVIMPSYLGEYEGAAKGREKKFIRAVESFRDQIYYNKELIIVSDGCQLTKEIFHKKFAGNGRIVLVEMEKQPLFSGNIRQAGINAATGDLIAYLDTDDLLGISHLSSIGTAFCNCECEWIYFNDYIKYNTGRSELRNVGIAKGQIGTSSIAHRNISEISWNGCDGYGHDWTFADRLKKTFPEVKKAYGMSYYVCHIPKMIDN